MILESLLKQIIDHINDRFRAEKIILFGSYADNAATPSSDVDLLIVAETDLRPAERYAVVRRQLADLPMAFDIIVKTPKEYMESKDVVNHIVYFADKYGKILYER